MNERIREMMEKRAAALQHARALLDAAAAENRSLNAEEEQQYNGYDAEIDQLTRDIDREQRLCEREEAAQRSANGGHNPARDRQPGGQESRTDDPTDSMEYRQSMIRYMATGQNDGRVQFDNYGGSETRTILGVSLTGTGATGGVLAPTQLEKALLDYNRDFNIMRKLASVRSSGSDVDIPYTTTHPTAYHVAEGAEFTASTQAWDKVSLKAYKAGALTVVTHEAMQDMFLNMEDWIREEFGMAFADLEENDFVNGTGSGQPTGFLATASSALTTASASAVTADELLDLAYAVDRKYRERGAFVMSDTAVKLVRKLKLGNGDYLWQPGLQAGQPDRLLGYEVHTCTKMPAVAASAKPVAFGDFKRYRILDRRGLYIQRLNELYATSGQVGFLAYRRYDGKLLDSAAVKVLTMHA